MHVEPTYWATISVRGKEGTDPWEPPMLPAKCPSEEDGSQMMSVDTEDQQSSNQLEGSETLGCHMMTSTGLTTWDVWSDWGWRGWLQAHDTISGNPQVVETCYGHVMDITLSSGDILGFVPCHFVQCLVYPLTHLWYILSVVEATWW